MIVLIPWRGAVALAYMGAIYGLSSLPGKALADLGVRGVIANLGHVPLFAVLAALVLWALVGPNLRCALAAIVFCFAFAVADEWHQKFVPYRVPSLADVAADGAGILIGASIVAGWRSRRESLAGGPNSRGDRLQ